MLTANPIQRIVPEQQLDALMAWVWKSLRQWVPGPGSDVSEFVPHVYVDRSGSVIGRVGEMSSEEAAYADTDVDPEWSGEVIARDDIRAKRTDGTWITAECQVKIVYEPRGAMFMGEWLEASRTLSILINWAEIDKVSTAVRGQAYEELIDAAKLSLRGILAHEITHMVDASSRTGEQIAGDPRAAVFPWEEQQWTELYVRQGPEKRAIQREALEGLKTLRKLGYYDPEAKAGAFPWALWRQLTDLSPNIRAMVEALRPAEKMQFMHELGRGYRLFDRSLSRRERYGRSR